MFAVKEMTLCSFDYMYFIENITSETKDNKTQLPEAFEWNSVVKQNQRSFRRENSEVYLE